MIAEDPRNVHVVYRKYGMGDVAMALCAVNALSRTGVEVIFRTSPLFFELALACPHVQDVTEDAWQAIKVWDINSSALGIGALHEVDAFLREFGLEDTNPLNKTLELNLPPEVIRKVSDLLTRTPDNRRVLVFPSVSDPNRTLPLATWNALIEKLVEEGFEVILLGENNMIWKSFEVSKPPGVIDLRNKLKILETVALMRRSACMVACDSGPIQLAGATEIGIVGIYSVASGTMRLPYRHGILAHAAVDLNPPCPMFPCYSQMHSREAWDKIQSLLDKGIDKTEVYAKWCPAETNFSCMTSIKVDTLFEACMRVGRC